MTSPKTLRRKLQKKLKRLKYKRCRSCSTGKMVCKKSVGYAIPLGADMFLMKCQWGCGHLVQVDWKGRRL